jgi:VCBS repeat-containing protein
VSGIVVSAEPHVVPDTGVILTDVMVLGTAPGGAAAVSGFSMQGGVVGDVGMWSEQFADLSVGQTVIAGVNEANGQLTAAQAPILTSGFSAPATSGLVAGTAAAASGYILNGYHFLDSSLPVPFYVNPAGLPAGAAASIAAAAQTWENDPGSYMDFTYMGATSSVPASGTDGVNVIGAGNLGNTTTLAQCMYWYVKSTHDILQFDITYNTAYYRYATDGNVSAYDVQGIGTHELGHTLSLDDLYDPADSAQVMYGVGVPGGTAQRVLKSGDIAGVRAIYPVAGPSTPQAVADSATVAEDATLTVAGPGVLSNDTDADGKPLSAQLVSAPSHGVLTLSATGAYTYRAAANWNGTDAFTYRAHSGSIFSAPAVVTITVTPVNDAPVSVADSATIAAETTLTVPAPGVLSNDTDVDGDPLTASLTAAPAHGALVLAANGAYRFVPDPGFSGTDAFAYRAYDGALYSAISTVTITVSLNNVAPVAVDDIAAVAENSGLSVSAPGVLANDTDADGNLLTAEMVSAPLHGTLSLLSDGSYTYQPSNDWFGTDFFTYRASDAATYSAPATVTITVIEVVPAPPANALPTTAIAVTAPSSIKRGRAFYISGSLSPAHSASSNVSLRIERYYRHRWRLVRRTSVAVPAGSTSFRYRTKLSPKGSWRVTASHAGDGIVDRGSASATRRFRVK